MDLDISDGEPEEDEPLGAFGWDLAENNLTNLFRLRAAVSLLSAARPLAARYSTVRRPFPRARSKEAVIFWQ
jgi:hypothetical protein